MVAKNQAPSVDALWLFKSEFAGDDFLKSNVGERGTRASLDHWPVPETKLTHALGYNVDKQLRVGNDLAGFLQELSRHNAQGVDGAGGLRRNWRIVGEQDEMGLGEKGEPSIATNRMVNVGSCRAVVKRFSAVPSSSGCPRRNWRSESQ